MAPPCPFHKGDPVYLAKGSYQGTIGTFLTVRDDPKWATIIEPNETIREHPLEWIAAMPQSARKPSAAEAVLVGA